MLKRSGLPEGVPFSRAPGPVSSLESGCFWEEKSTPLILLAEQYIVDDQWELCPTPEETLREEIGHAYDAAKGSGGKWFSSLDSEFRRAYHAESRPILLDAGLRETLSYYLQRGRNGRRELFAQLFATILGGCVLGPVFDDWFRRDFPRCLRVVDSLILR